MRWFISDTHFGHNGIIGLAHRPFDDTGVMDSTMIRNWNARVSEDDIVYHLGDFAMSKGWGQYYAATILAQLKGYKVLIRGNHDGTKTKMSMLGFDEVHDTIDVPYEGQTFTLVHRPQFLKPSKNLILCGHIHDQWYMFGNCLNMSVEMWNYTPVCLPEIQRRIEWLREVYDTNMTQKLFAKGFKEIHPPMPIGVIG